MDETKLTQYSHGDSCSYKIAPAVLNTILHSEVEKFIAINLLVGNGERDDTAALDLGKNMALIATTDFFL